MKFSCPSTEEKYKRRLNYLSNWHRFFCLWPRRMAPMNAAGLNMLGEKGGAMPILPVWNGGNGNIVPWTNEL